MIKKTVVTFDEQKSEYTNIDKNYMNDNFVSEDTTMNKMLTQLVVIGFIGMIMLYFVFQSFTNKSNIEDEQLAEGIVFELREEDQALIIGIEDIEIFAYTMSYSQDIESINQGTMDIEARISYKKLFS